MNKNLIKYIFIFIIVVMVLLSSYILTSHSYYLTSTESTLFGGSFDILGLYDVVVNVYVESDTGTKYRKGTYYELESSIPSYINSSYKYEADCKRTDVDTTFTYDFTNKKLKTITNGKNLCYIYFYKYDGDIILNVYLKENNSYTLVDDISGSHTIDTFTCKDKDGNDITSKSIITYDESTGIHMGIGALQGTCNVYLT